MSLLTVVQDHCKRSGLPSPSAVTSTTDDMYLQMVALVNEVVEDMVNRADWQGIVAEKTFTSLAAASQGTLVSLMSSYFHSIVNDTIYNRTTKIPIFGPLAAREYQHRKAIGSTTPYHQYRIYAGSLYLDPAPVAGQTLAWEWKTSAAVTLSGGGTSDRAASDGDTFLIPERIVLAGLRWKWKYEKGQPYGEEFRRYEAMITDAIAKDKTARLIDMGDSRRSPVPGIIVPEGSWSL